MGRRLERPKGREGVGEHKNRGQQHRDDVEGKEAKGREGVISYIKWKRKKRNDDEIKALVWIADEWADRSKF